MEVNNVDSLRFFKIIDKGKYVQVHSPHLEKGLTSFKEKRAFYVKFKILEAVLKKPWNTYTKLTNPTMMKILWKLGAKPYHIDLKTESIWFIKGNNNANL